MPGTAAVTQEAAETLRFSSGESRVAMIELYTSEGCNSCPPADRWLSRLKEYPGLWTRVVPVAFHVDYWDYIGWEDRFARPDFSHRQRRYAAEGGARFVYTPGVFRNGLEWHGWRRDESVRSASEAVGNLELRVEGDSVELQFDASAELEQPRAHVAILGMNLESDVRAGENAGKTLKHDFVVLEQRSIALEPGEQGFTASTRLPVVSMEAPKRAIVAWVSAADSLAPVQAVGGYLPDFTDASR